jgi:hypothetical protein
MRFAVPAFRFALPGSLVAMNGPESALGRWSRIATMGTKEKDGARMVFDASTLGEMVSNAEARGDAIAICSDHASAYPETRDAPALGFFGALAVVSAGTVVKSWNGAPDPTGLEDGLWARLDTITPRGYDSLVGLANYRTLSPFFVTKGKAEDGTPVGYQLLDVAATNVPFQAGAELCFFGLPAGQPDAEAEAQLRAIESSTKAAPSNAGTVQRLSRGNPMGPEDLKRFGINEDDDDATKSSKMAAFWADYDKKMSAAAPAAMAATEDHKEPDGDETQAMSALSAALTARGVKVPDGANRSVLMSLAALAPVPDVSALVKAEMDRRDAERKAADEKVEREQLVSMARTAKAPEHEIVALGLIPLASAREMASKYGASSAPTHLFNRVTANGGPLAGPTATAARTMPQGNPAVHIRESKDRIVVENDGEAAKLARDMRDSTEPTIMSRVDTRAMEKYSRIDGLTRTLAAQQLVEEDHPHLISRAG